MSLAMISYARHTKRGERHFENGRNYGKFRTEDRSGVTIRDEISSCTDIYPIRNLDLSLNNSNHENEIFNGTSNDLLLYNLLLSNNYCIEIQSLLVTTYLIHFFVIFTLHSYAFIATFDPKNKITSF